MSAGKLDLPLEDGVDLPVHLVCTDDDGVVQDLTGYTSLMQVRRAPGSAVLLEKSTGDASITLGGALGTIDFTLSAAQVTALLPAAARGAYWDIFITSAGGVETKLLMGQVVIAPKITEAAP